jgi:hypothetical protein
MISNHLAIFLIVDITWWPALQPIEGMALAHKGKAMSDVDYNPEDPPMAYSNATVHSHLSQCTEMTRMVHGPEYDPSTQTLMQKSS